MRPPPTGAAFLPLEVRVRVRVGYEISYEFPQPTPMIATLNVHYSRASDLVRPDTMMTTPATPFSSYRDGFGNWCNRLVAPAGGFTISADTLVRDDGKLDEVGETAEQHAIADLPDETLVYLLGSRYCDTDKLVDVAWDLFGHLPTGWSRRSTSTSTATSPSVTSGPGRP